MGEMILELPFPPSVNTYWRKFTQGRFTRMILSKRARAYKVEVAALMLAARAQRRVSCEVDAEIDFYPPDRRRRDQDNFEKGLWDSLVNAGVLVDDSLVKNVQKRWHDPVKGGKAVVTLKQRRGS